MSLLEERRALNCFPVTGGICHIPEIEAFGAHLEELQATYKKSKDIVGDGGDGGESNSP